MLLLNEEMRKLVMAQLNLFHKSGVAQPLALPGIEDKHNGEWNQEIEDSGGHREVKGSLIHVLGIKWHGTPGRLLQVLTIVLHIVHLKIN